MTPPLLEAKGLTKRFGSVVALSGVSFDLEHGEVHAICGENGAGKSTLIKLLAGVYGWGSYEGEIHLKGQPARFAGRADAARQGIGVIHQELSLIPDLSVAENVFLGRELTRGGLLDHGRMRRLAKELLDSFQVAIDPDAKVSELGVGLRQVVEIAKALSARCQILILDEPTAALSQPEVQHLIAVVRKLCTRGVGCIYISHKLDEVFELSDRITVLRDGQYVRTYDTREVTSDDVVRAMVGRELGTLYPDRASARGSVCLSVRGLSVVDPATSVTRLKDIDLTVHEGEVLGIGGLMGAGRSELLLHLVGAWGTRQAGEVRLRDQPLLCQNPAQALARGLVLVPEDRKHSGLVLDQSVRFNLTLASLPTFVRHGLIDPVREQSICEKSALDLRVKAASIEVPVRNLSGGNQQKVVLGKALLTRPRVVLLDEPTRGVDVGAKAEIYALIRALTEAGLAVIMVSSELPELLGMSDRILMLANGRVSGTFKPQAATEHSLLSAAVASSAA